MDGVGFYFLFRIDTRLLKVIASVAGYIHLDGWTTSCLLPLCSFSMFSLASTTVFKSVVTF